MLDMETCGLKEDAALLSISMVAFRPGEEHEVDVFDVSVDLVSCYMAGMQFDESTQAWWMKQDVTARLEQTMCNSRISIQEAMKSAYDWLRCLSETNDLVMWSRGTDFDFPKLEYGLRRFVEKEPPYHFWNKRDVRTFIRELGVDDRNMEREGVKHRSLDDCRHQVKLVRMAYTRLVHMQALLNKEQQ